VSIWRSGSKAPIILNLDTMRGWSASRSYHFTLKDTEQVMQWFRDNYVNHSRKYNQVLMFIEATCFEPRGWSSGNINVK